jgi:hypothetical protein
MRFLTLSEAAPVTATACLKCGHVELYVDLHKLGKMLKPD